MVINTSLPVSSSPLSKSSPAKPAAPGAGDSSSAVSAPLAFNLADISSLDEAQQSVGFAQNSILNQSSLALLAQGNLSPETVYSLLQQ